MKGIIRGHQIGQFSGDADNEMMKMNNEQVISSIYNILTNRNTRPNDLMMVLQTGLENLDNPSTRDLLDLRDAFEMYHYRYAPRNPRYHLDSNYCNIFENQLSNTFRNLLENNWELARPMNFNDWGFQI